MFYHGKIHVQPKLNQRHRQILRVSLEYPTEIRQQWNASYCPLAKAIISDDPFVATTLPALDKFTHINLAINKPTQYSDSVKSDFLGALVVVNIVFPCDIYTLNNCEAKVRDGINLFTNVMNHNTCHKDVISKLREIHGNKI